MHNSLEKVRINFNVPVLSTEQIREKCPVAFRTNPSNPSLSSQYTHVNSSTIIEDLDKLGWKPVEATMRKNRKEDTIFTKHMIIFQNLDIMVQNDNGDDVFPRILMINSHDGLNAFSFSVGLFRVICSNGLVISDENFSSFKIRHKGYTFEELRQKVQGVIEMLPEKVEVLNRMKGRILTKDEKHKLAYDSYLTRLPLNKQYEKDSDARKELVDDLLEPTRELDKGDDLWTVFNVLQEKITQGGFLAALKGAKIRKVRKITSFEKDVEINKKLFTLATSLLNE